MQRFWDTASGHSDGNSFTVLLDGRELRLPGRFTSAPLLLPSLALASAIAAEWQIAGVRRGGSFNMAALPLTCLAATAQNRITLDADAVIDALTAYGASDLLCYRATSPATLVTRQEMLWRPWLKWAADTLDAPLNTVSGITYIAQPGRSLAALRKAIASYDIFILAALGVAVPALGSLVLGLAIAAGVLSAASAYQLSEVDAAFQSDMWGEDVDARERRLRIAQDVEEAAVFMALARTT